MTIGELYAAAGPITATVILIFTPIGITASWILLAEWWMPIDEVAK